MSALKDYSVIVDYCRKRGLTAMDVRGWGGLKRIDVAMKAGVNGTLTKAQWSNVARFLEADGRGGSGVSPTAGGRVMADEDPRIQAVANAIGHYSCEDCWYSCPLSPDGCCDDRYAADECNCGLNEKAARVVAAIDALAARGSTEGPQPPKDATK